MFWDNDPTNALTATGEAAVNVGMAHNGAMFQVSQGGRASCPIDFGGRRFFINPTGGDEREYAACQLWLLCSQAINNSNPIGDIYLEWEVEFMTPNIQGLTPSITPATAGDHAMVVTNQSSTNIPTGVGTIVTLQLVAGRYNSAWLNVGTAGGFKLQPGFYHMKFQVTFKNGGAGISAGGIFSAWMHASTIVPDVTKAIAFATVYPSVTANDYYVTSGGSYYFAITPAQVGAGNNEICLFAQSNISAGTVAAHAGPATGYSSTNVIIERIDKA